MVGSVKTNFDNELINESGTIKNKNIVQIPMVWPRIYNNNENTKNYNIFVNVSISEKYMRGFHIITNYYLVCSNHRNVSFKSECIAKKTELYFTCMCRLKRHWDKYSFETNWHLFLSVNIHDTCLQKLNAKCVMKWNKAKKSLCSVLSWKQS